MNKYPAWWDATVTIYNKSVGSDNRITWYSTVVTGAFWKIRGEKVTVGETVIDSSSTICRLRVDNNYCTPDAWDNLSTKNGKYTLRAGDIIVFGSVSDAINEYVAGTRSTDILKKYRDSTGAMQVNQVRINAGTGMGQEHYYVRGI